LVSPTTVNLNRSRSIRVTMASKPNATVASERTPLINGESASSNGGHHHHHHIIGGHHSTRSAAYQFFFDANHTPGNGSDKFVIRSLAYTWHVTKVTLLSSKLRRHWSAIAVY
jgi:Ca2+:H+ antiporter